MFADSPDPRRETANTLHALTDILVLATGAVISGCDTWDDLAEYGEVQEVFFRRFLPLANGIPSADTLSRVFAKLNPARFAQAFGRGMAAACEGSGLVPIAVDGKAARSAPANTATGRLTVGSAWATANRLTLGPVAVPDGSNETGVIPELLAVLELKGAIVTIDAAGRQVGNARLIREREGHSLLAVKGNQPALQAAVEGAFGRACEAEFVGVRHDTHVDVDVDDRHGRHEERSVTVLPAPADLPGEWVGANAVVQVCRERVVGGVRTSSTHSDLSSHAGTAAELGGFIRGHWGIESMHWVWEVVFREDDSRVQEGHAGANLAMLRRVAVSLLRRAPGKKRATTPTKRKKAGWDDNYLLQVLQGISG